MQQEIIDRLMAVNEDERAILEGRGMQYPEDEILMITAKELLDVGKLINISKHTRFASFPKHRHDFVEMVYMCKGSTVHIVNNKEILLSEGDVLILNQNAVQEILPAGENDIAVNFTILPQFFDKTLEMLNEEETPLRRFIINCTAGHSDTDGYLHFKTGDILTVHNLLENLIYTIIHDTPNKRKINEFTMGLLFLQFINYSDRLGFEDNEQSVIASVLKYIEDNYKDGSLSEIADILHYDLYWLSREIKRRTGRTYTELLQEKRLSQAAYLLANTGINVSDIAESVGYNNISYFYRIFAERFGVSPKKYRDKH